jgi:hypothetical protein
VGLGSEGYYRTLATLGQLFAQSLFSSTFAIGQPEIRFLDVSKFGQHLNLLILPGKSNKLE